MPRGLLLLPLPLLGCHFQPPRVATPGIDPQAAASAAIAQYDTDQDLQLSSTELESCPGLRQSADLYDVDGDGRLSQAEIAARLQAMLQSGIGRMPCMCVLTANRRPLVGAKVDLDPEPFLQGAIQPASGTTNDRGVAKPVTHGAPPGLPGIEFGLYRVRVTHPERDIPARYDAESELGFELSPLERDRDTAVFDLRLP
jgi:hypothetical protein